MKKYFYFLLIGISLFSSCVRIEASKAQSEFENNSNEYAGLIHEVYEFNYKGHDYISFEGYTMNSGFSVVHNPDCKACKNISNR